MLKIEHLTKTYGGKPAVQDLCLHIRPGELCAFIGHNGAGKTTTLKCCCGIQQFDVGEIYVDGISVRNDPLVQAPLGLPAGRPAAVRLYDRHPVP